MKRTLVSLIYLLIMSAVMPIQAQLSESTPLITVDVKQIELSELFTEIEKQSGLFFSYESSLLKSTPLISFKAKDESLTSCLKRLCVLLGVTYRITNQYIILKKIPKQYTISGFVRDSVSYESLINASVVESLKEKGVMSNNYGFYSITLPPGKTILHSSYVGYKIKEVSLELSKDTMIDLMLIPSGALGEVEIRGHSLHSEVMNSRMGNIELSSKQITQLPVLLGESDPIKTLQNISGVVPGSEGLAGLFVRGGNGDENLFLLDGVPLYNVSHLGGVFSTYNSDIVKNIDFYKGGFPARYGGRLSSIIDVRLKDGDMQKYHGNISMGLLSARANIEGPIIKDKTSFNVSFRRTWLDAITSPIYALSNQSDKSGDNFAGYSFYDWNAKISHKFSTKNRLYANFYMGQDRLRDKSWWYGEDKERGGHDMKWRWGNLLSSLNWTSILSNNLFGDITLFYTRYKSRKEEEQGLVDYVSTKIERKNLNSYNYSGIEDWGTRINFDYYPFSAHHLRFGGEYLYHHYEPEHHWVDITTKKENRKIIYADEDVYAHEWSGYIEDDWQIDKRWKINFGTRLARYQVEQRSYNSFLPRFSLRYLITKDLSTKLSYVKMDQYVHRLATTFASLPSDVWVPVTDKVKPMTSDQVSLGLYYNYKKQLDFSVEGYYKEMNNLIEYQDYSSLFPKYTNWDQRIAMGSGRAYGMDFMVRKTEGKTSGWISYSLAWADRIFNDGTVNSGKRFPAKFENRHRFNISVTHKITPKVDVNVSWTYASGNRVTIPVDEYLEHNLLDLSSYDPSYDPFYGPTLSIKERVYERNGIKLSDYHRLDLSLNVYRPKKNGRMGIWNISIYNAYCRVNPFFVGYSYKNEGRSVFLQKGLLPIIPSITYTYKF